MSLMDDNYYKNKEINPAGPYDRMDTVLHRIAWAKENAQPNWVVLDLGCADGYTLFSIEKDIPIGGIGVDLNEKLIEEARARAKDTNLIFYQEPITKRWFEDVDMICMFEVIEHIKEPQLVWDYMKKYKGAQLFLTTPLKEGMYGESNPDPEHINIYSQKRLEAEIGSFATIVDLHIQDDLLHIQAVIR